MHKLLHWIKVISVAILLVSWSGPLAKVSAQNQPLTKSVSHIVIDSQNGQILSNQDQTELVEVGALSKVLTLYIVYQAIDEGKISLSDLVPISDEAYSLSQDYDIFNVPLRQDFQYTVQELIEAVLVTGANGATLALAEFISGTEKDFVSVMVDQLKEWGLNDARLYNSTGLARDFIPNNIDTLNDGPVNTMDAQTCAIITYHLLRKHPEILEITQQTRAVFKPKTDDPFEMTTTLGMLPGMAYEYEGVNGFLLGTSLKQGDSAIVTSSKNGLTVISVVLGTGNQGQGSRYNETAKLLNYVYATYQPGIIVKKGQEVTQMGQMKVINSEVSTAVLDYGRELSLAVPMIDTAPRFVYEFEPNEDVVNPDGVLVAPLKSGTKIGKMVINVENYPTNYIPTAQANSVWVVLRHSLAEAPWYTQMWNGMGQAVGDSWEATRKFFTDLFN